MAIGKGNTTSRDQVCYDKKVRRMKFWHSRLLRLREEAIKEKPELSTAHRWKDLRPLDHYIDLLKSPVGGEKKKK